MSKKDAIQTMPEGQKAGVDQAAERSADAVDRELTALARRINAEHTAAEGSLRKGLGHARGAGELLLEAKARVSHGGWLSWLKANVPFSERTARSYMRVAKCWNELADKSATVADLTYRQAVELLADAQGPKEISVSYVQEVPEPKVVPYTIRFHEPQAPATQEAGPGEGCPAGVAGGPTGIRERGVVPAAAAESPALVELKRWWMRASTEDRDAFHSHIGAS